MRTHLCPPSSPRRLISAIPPCDRRQQSCRAGVTGATWIGHLLNFFRVLSFNGAGRDAGCFDGLLLPEIKHLPVGDALWIARHKELNTEYVLDFIVERKNVDDLLGSIKDNRYKEQKLRLKECGLRKLIYLVEGDPNTVDGSESVKTACFTTEVLEGFDVQRTTGYADTEKKYGHLTGSIIDYYSTNFSASAGTSRLCLTYDEFVKRCSDLGKVTVSDIFALQLMQVPQVTEEAALAVTSLYPTLLSLARAYNMLDGDRRAQEELLKNKSDMVNAGASKNIFRLIWAEG